MTDEIMELVQVYASAWALVGGRFDRGNGMKDALEAKAEVVAALEGLVNAQKQIDADEALMREALNALLNVYTVDVYTTDAATRLKQRLENK